MIGASTAGLSAAAVLASRFTQVVIAESDVPPHRHVERLRRARPPAALLKPRIVVAVRRASRRAAGATVDVPRPERRSVAA